MNNNEILLLKLGEVVLKGLNRRAFEDKLMSNVRRRVRACGSFQIYIRQSTIYVEPQNENCDIEAAFAACRQVFGIAAIARAVPCDKDVDAIVATAKQYLSEEFAKARTFKVESKRADKLFHLNSIQISQAVGGELAEAFPHVAVDVHKPDLTVYVEIREKHAYVHAPSVPGAGGLPIGMGGTAVSLLSGGLDSPVSSWMIARRGVQLEMVHFVSPPYTSDQALEKVLQLARELTAYTGRTIVHIIPFTEIQEEIRKNCPEEFAKARTFKVESKRADKLFHLNSIQISQAVGGELAEAFPHVAVDVHKPDLTVYVEIREKHAYVHAPSVPGAGGLPIGMGGTAISLLSGGLDSPVSSCIDERPLFTCPKYVFPRASPVLHEQ